MTMEDPKPAAAAPFTGQTCLQYLLYDDGDIAMWIIDHYQTEDCTDIPLQEYLFTECGLLAPQVCGGVNGYPKCDEAYVVARKAKAEGAATPDNPFLKTPLGPFPSDDFLDWLDRKQVRYPDNTSVSAETFNGNTVWDAKSGLEHGEFDKEYVKVRKLNGRENEWVVLRLSDGVARMGAINFAENAKPRLERNKNTVRPFSIGFESTKPDSQVGIVVTAKPWVGRYERSNTAFTVTHEGVEYHVLTKTPVQVTP